MTFTSILFYEILQICLKGTFLEVYVSCQPPMLSGFYKNVNGFLWVDNYFPSEAWDNSFI